MMINKAGKFDESIPSINKIVFSIGGYFLGYETRTFTFDEKVHVEVAKSILATEKKYTVTHDLSKEDFFKELQELHIGEWDSDYTNHNVLDGTQWELEIDFSDGNRPVKIYGSNEYPYNFKALTELLGVEDF